MLQLRQIQYSVDHHEAGDGRSPDQHVLLDQISFRAPRSHLMAIVGPSGCGKSTLLKMVAGLIEADHGAITWDDRDLQHHDLAPGEIGYVPQFSIAHERMTVEENLRSAIRLRVKVRSKAVLQDRVEQILKQTGLQDLANRPVRVLSGGQKRRLGLALEITSNPVLLLADEVTSGLDPKSELEITQLLRQLASDGQRLVLCVTHGLSLLHLYDSVLVMHEGRIAYHGSPRQMLKYFQVTSAEEVFPKLGQATGAVIHQRWRNERREVRAASRQEQTEETFEHGREAFPTEEDEPTFSEADLSLSRMDLSQISKPPELSFTAGRSSKQKTSAPESGSPSSAAIRPGLLTQFFELLWRRWLIFQRNPGEMALHLGMFLGFPFLVVIFALDGLPELGGFPEFVNNPVKAIQATADFRQRQVDVGSLISGLVMFQVILLTLMGSNNSAREIASERPIFEKEKLAGLRPLAYASSKAAFTLTLVVAQALWMGIFVRLICQLPGDFLLQLGFLVLVTAAMTSVCLAISSLMSSAEQASLLSIYLVGFQLPLSGAILALPDSLVWLTRPWIASYWGWSGFLQTMQDTLYFDAVRIVSKTEFSDILLCSWVLSFHIILGLMLAWFGCKLNKWR